MKPTLPILLVAGLLTANVAEAKWQRLPTLKDRPLENGAKGMISTATLESTSGIGRSQALLSMDVTEGCTVAAGNSNAIINLGKPILISRSSFVNDGVEGRATLSGSADKKTWATLDEKVFTASDREITFAFAGIQAKYVRLDLVLSKGGSIRHFQMTGDEADRNYTVKQTADGKGGYPVNFAGIGGTRVIYASPKPLGGLDTAATFNKFSFPESEERYRTLIYDLGQLRILNEFGSIHSPRPVRFEVFSFDRLPESEDWRGRLAFDPAEFNAKVPVAAAEDPQGRGVIKAYPSDGSVKTRYLAMRWEPDFNPPAFETNGANIVGNGTVQPDRDGGGPGGNSDQSPIEGDNADQQAAQQDAITGDPEPGPPNPADGQSAGQPGDGQAGQPGGGQSGQPGVGGQPGQGGQPGPISGNPLGGAPSLGGGGSNVPVSNGGK